MRERDEEERKGVKSQIEWQELSAKAFTVFTLNILTLFLLW